MVDISGLDRMVLLKALWSNAKPAAFFTMGLGFSKGAPGWDEEEAKKEIFNGYVDYVCGRCIKCYLFCESTTVDPGLYDREYGDGAFSKVVASLK